jgi:hypothetical protein
MSFYRILTLLLHEHVSNPISALLFANTTIWNLNFQKVPRHLPTLSAMCNIILSTRPDGILIHPRSFLILIAHRTLERFRFREVQISRGSDFERFGLAAAWPHEMFGVLGVESSTPPKKHSPKYLLIKCQALFFCDSLRKRCIILLIAFQNSFYGSILNSS